MVERRLRTILGKKSYFQYMNSPLVNSFFFSILILVSNTIVAQTLKPQIRLYAYEQKVHSGIDHQTTKIDQTTTKSPRNSSVQYFVYAESSNASVVAIRRIWIHRQVYEVKTETINTPVIITKSVALEGESRSDTLVKTTRNIVWRLSLEKIANNQTSKPSLSKKIASNEIVVEYTVNKSTLLYASLPKIKKLALGAMY